MKIAINAINAKSYGITNYTMHLCSSLLDYLDGSITLFITEDMVSRYTNLDTRCIVVVLPFTSTIIKTAIMQLGGWWIFRSFDMVHSVANIGSRFLLIPQVITIHDSYELKSPERFSLKKRFLMQLLIRGAISKAQSIIAVSENTKHDIVAGYPRAQGKVVRIYSGCNVPQVAHDEIKKRSVDPYFLFVGTLEPGKNLITLLDAFKKSALNGYTLKIVGAQGWGELDTTAYRSCSIEFCGGVSNQELLQLYSHATALVFPSLYEGFGFPIIEAYAQGTLVIAARNSAIPEAGGEAALYFETLNSDELAKKMQEVVLYSAKKRQQRIALGLAHSCTFSWKKCGKETYDLYKQVITK